jgi:uncharacterized protein (TIGR02145 family)
MKTKTKAALAALMLVVISCKKEIHNFQSFTTDNSAQQNIIRPYSIDSITIGTQVWMKKNLDVSRYGNGDTIPEVKDAARWATLTTRAWCWYNNDSATGDVYGKLYNWYAINDRRGLAPEGWHIPTDSEWLATQTFLGTAAGGKMKETGTTHWFNPNIGAPNSSGFTGLPGGYRSEIGQFCYKTYLGLWWTSTDYNTTVAWYRRLLCFSPVLDRWRFPKQMGFSVRCIKN